MAEGSEMSVRGWVYVIVNDAMPGLVKVGYSTKDPQLRAAELGGTGVPLPFTVAYDALVIEPRTIEQKVHQELSDRRKGKEWFCCGVAEAAAVIREVARGDLILENGDTNTADPRVQFSDVRPSSGSSFDYVCRFCDHVTSQPNSHVVRCSYCGKTEILT